MSHDQTLPESGTAVKAVGLGCERGVKPGTPAAGAEVRVRRGQLAHGGVIRVPSASTASRPMEVVTQEIAV